MQPNYAKICILMVSSILCIMLQVETHKETTVLTVKTSLWNKIKHQSLWQISAH